MVTLIGLEFHAPGFMRKYTATWVKHTMPSDSIQWTRMVNESQAHELELYESSSRRVCCVHLEGKNLSNFVSSIFEKLINIDAVIFVSTDEICEIKDYCLEDTEFSFPSLMVPKPVGEMFLNRLTASSEVKVRINISTGM